MTATTYATTLNCFDGAVQAPARKYMKRRFRVKNVDPITEPGIEKILAALADGSDNPKMKFMRELIKEKLRISIVYHGSRALSIAAHHKCLGNSAEKEEKLEQLVRGKEVIEEMIRELNLDHLEIEKVLLWINERLLPEEVHIPPDGSLSTHERLLEEVTA